MTERIMYSERHAEYNKQENDQQMILVMNVNTLVYTEGPMHISSGVSVAHIGRMSWGLKRFFV